MQEYHAYLISSDGRFENRVGLYCEDDDTAKERAKQLVNGCAIELWQGNRKIALFAAEP